MTSFLNSNSIVNKVNLSRSRTPSYTSIWTHFPLLFVTTDKKNPWELKETEPDQDVLLLSET
jgi:hypothetical protein